MPVAQSGPFGLSPLFEAHGLPLAILGIVVVFIALALIVLVMLLVARLPRFRGAVPVGSARAPVGLPDQGEALPEETLVVIAAAVSEVVRAPHRIIRIRALTPDDLGWSLEGRIQLHQSHAVHLRDRE